MALSRAARVRVLKSIIEGLENDLGRLDDRIQKKTFLPLFYKDKKDRPLWEALAELHVSGAEKRINSYKARLAKTKAARVKNLIKVENVQDPAST